MPLVTGALAIVALLAAELLSPRDWREGWRELAFDLVLAGDHRLRSPTESSHVVVVDIDRRSLEALGPWPWPRARIAALVEAVVAARPAVVAIDILFAQQDVSCARSNPPSGACETTGLAGQSNEGDRLLAREGLQVPLVLGFLLDPQGTGPLLSVPMLMRGSPALDEVWSATGAVVPPALLTKSASGLGALSLPASRDGVVRYVPLLVGVGGYVRPGLALEAMRVFHKASAYLIQSAPLLLATGDLRIPIASDGLLRLAPDTIERRAARTISAIDLIERRVDLTSIADTIALVGGSAPELGGLRETVNDPLTPSVQIQADAIAQIDAGRFPRPVGSARATQLLLVLVLTGLALTASALLPPALGAFAVIGAIVLAWASAIVGSVLTDRLVDPLIPSFAAAVVFVIAVVTSFAVTHRREVLVRHRFEQHLAPAVVQRIIEQPNLLKLGGESREVTALFTDVEGFTAMTHRAGPEQLVAVLDSYFEGVAAIIVEHGGMIDKIVGDAVHALFNAPLDLEDHPRRAVECAVAIRSWADRYRTLPAPAAIGFGRTRIGIETGRAIVGDVGLHSKLDYTAHGDAVNAAARLEAANKQLGSSICVGPAAADRCNAGMLRPLGTISVQGRDEPLAVFEPWPDDASAEWRERYMAAFGLMAGQPERAAALFCELSLKAGVDPVARGIAQRLREAAEPSVA
jgi:adenylate cyclase